MPNARKNAHVTCLALIVIVTATALLALRHAPAAESWRLANETPAMGLEGEGSFTIA